MTVNQNREDRRAEWSMVRKTALLGDVVDEDTFADMCGVIKKSLRNRRTSHGHWYNIEIPSPIARPDGMKPIFLKSEASLFAAKFKAARAARKR